MGTHKCGLAGACHSRYFSLSNKFFLGNFVSSIFLHSVAPSAAPGATSNPTDAVHVHVHDLNVSIHLHYGPDTPAHCFINVCISWARFMLHEYSKLALQTMPTSRTARDQPSAACPHLSGCSYMKFQISIIRLGATVIRTVYHRP